MTATKITWKEKIPFILLMIGSILFYGITIFSNPESFRWDPDHYKWLGVNLRVNGVYGFGDRPTAYRPPLYPALLAAGSYGTGLLPESADMKELGERLPYQVPAGLNLLFAVLTVVLTYRIGRHIGLAPWIAGVAGLFVLIDPILSSVAQQSRLETTTTFLMVLVIDRLLALEQTRRHRTLKFFGTGLLIGIAALCRPNFLAYGLLCSPFIVLLEWLRTRSFCAIWAGSLFLAGIACVILPWGIRNQRQMGRFIPTTTHGGMTLFMVNCDSYYNNDRPFQRKHPYTEEINAAAVAIYQRLQIPIPPDLLERIPKEDLKTLAMWQMPHIITRPEQEWMLDDAYYAEAKRAIAARKGDFLQATLDRFRLLWYPSDGRLFSVDYFLYPVEFLMMFYGILFLARKSLPIFTLKESGLSGQIPLAAGCWLVLSILSIQLPHLFFNVELGRMRAPIQPAIALLAVYGIYSLIEAYLKMCTSKQERRKISAE